VRKGCRSSLRHLLRLLCAIDPAPGGAEDADILASVPRIYTKQGDDGTTGLLYGGRVSKADPVTEACGTVDEAVAILGLARANTDDGAGEQELLGLQRELFVVGADLATNPDERGKLEPGISLVTEEMSARLEDRIDELVRAHPLPNAFIVPGANPASAALDVARSVIRRAERRVVELRDSGAEVNQAALRYLNRLSDLLFVLARVAAGETEPASR
jgi:cob(I)alamin adenosyltransferase